MGIYWFEGCRALEGHIGIMENQMEKNMEKELDTVLCRIYEL